MNALFNERASLSQQTRWRHHAINQNIPFEETYNEQREKVHLRNSLGMKPLDSSKSEAAINQSL